MIQLRIVTHAFCPTRYCRYTLNYADEIGKFEDTVKDKGVTVVIEPKAIMHIVGTTMDFVEDELAAEFVFHNPNATVRLLAFLVHSETMLVSNCTVAFCR